METSHHYTIASGLLLITTGLSIRYMIGRRRFKRRGIAGIPYFSSYFRLIVTTMIERLILLLADLCSFIGALLLAAAGFHHLK